MQKSCYVIIRGRVQGVGYRWFARERAMVLNLNGYVKNLANGDVEVFAQGEENNLNEYLILLKKGPSFSNVTDLKVDFGEPDKRYKEFGVEF